MDTGSIIGQIGIFGAGLCNADITALGVDGTAVHGGIVAHEGAAVHRDGACGTHIDGCAVGMGIAGKIAAADGKSTVCDNSAGAAGAGDDAAGQIRTIRAGGCRTCHPEMGRCIHIARAGGSAAVTDGQRAVISDGIHAGCCGDRLAVQADGDGLARCHSQGFGQRQVVFHNIAAGSQRAACGQGCPAAVVVCFCCQRGQGEQGAHHGRQKQAQNESLLHIDSLR